MSTTESTCIVVNWEGVDELCGFTANWVAMDKGGDWYAYSDKPKCCEVVWNSSGKEVRIHGVIAIIGRVDWRESLVERTAQVDPVNHPSHYTQGGVETIVAIAAVVAGYTGHSAYCAGNVVKYVARAPFKGALVEDLRKAAWYLDALIKEVDK